MEEVRYILTMTNDDTRSVHVPFMGDYVSLRRNPQWKDSLRRNGLKRLDRHVVFADFANKINRSNGKVATICGALITQFAQNPSLMTAAVW